MNIILCGMPGSGKSLFGQLVATQLNRLFIDTDDLIKEEYFSRNNQRATCREISLNEGDVYFRSLESIILQKLSGTKNAIIATGGGSLSTPENISVLKELGCLIYLYVPADVILKRLINKESLPSYLNINDIEGSFNTLLRQRLPLYEKHSHYIIDTTTEDVIEMVTQYATLTKEENHG